MRGVRDRLSAPARLPGIDLARGLAVVGMLAAHLLALEPFAWDAPATWIAVVEGRSSILFALAAGVSLALTTGGAEPLRGSAARVARDRLLVRAVALWGIGILLLLTGVPVYVILPAYGILFVIAAPLLAVGVRGLVAIAAALLVTMPFVQAALGLLPFWQTDAGMLTEYLTGWAYPFPLWAGYLTAGLAIGRLDLRARRTAGMLVVVGSSLAAVGYGIGAVWDSTEGAPPGVLAVAMSMEPHSGGLPEAVGGTGFVVALVGACLLVCRSRVAALLLLPLRATGSMPLTAYSAQIVIWAVWSFVALGDTTDLRGFRALHPFWPITLAVIVSCTSWALRVGRGPLEDLLRRLARRLVPGP